MAIINLERYTSLPSLFLIAKISLYIQNSANIIVQDRITGHLEEEKMQVYVRLGIRLLYKGATSRMEGGRGLLFSLILFLYC